MGRVPIEWLFAATHGSQGGTTFRRAPFFRTKKVGLLGATDSLIYAPWGDRSWTLTCHPCCRARCRREPDWYFDMHRPECFRGQKKSWNKDYYSWLTHLQTPIFMQEEWPDVPMAVRYPIEQIEAEFATNVTGNLYVSNHCDYMIALAMTEGVEQLGIWGCQYAGNERGVQRESFLYWLGRFEQYGGKIIVPRKRNTLMLRPLYGYASHDEHGKLTPDYRPPKMVDPPVAAGTSSLPLPTGPPLLTSDGLMPLPPGEPVREFAFD